MHKPVGQVLFAVFEKFTGAYLFQIAWEKSCDYLLIIFTKNITTTTNFDSVRVFSSFNGLAETDYHLCQIQTFSRPMFPNNHSAKNLEMCKDWFYMVTSRLKITRFTIISKTKCYEGSAFTRRLLQEVYCCFGNQERTFRAARDKTLAELFNDCSSLSVPKTPSQLDSWRKFWDLQPENEQGAICFLSTLPSLGEWTHSCCDVGNCQY